MKASVLKRVHKLIRRDVQALKSYHVPDFTGLIKLDAMENPFSWPGDLHSQWMDSLANVNVNRYPDPHAKELIQKIREFMGVSDEFDIMLGNGSDELIQIIALAVASEGRTIMAPEPSFVMYSMIATFSGLGYVGVPLGESFELDLAAFKESMEEHSPAVVFLAQPNNPTGNLFGEEKVRRIIENCPGLVVLDEAYLPFSDSNLMPLLQDYDNVVIMRTFSKMGLAGLRLGVLVGRPEWIVEFDKLRLPYNINVLTQESAKFALDNVAVLNQQTALLRQSREIFQTQLSEIPDIRIYASEANFILLKLLAGSARDIFTKLKEAGILIKCLDGAHPLLENCLRITVGTDSENSSFLAVFGSLMSADS